MPDVNAAVACQYALPTHQVWTAAAHGAEAGTAIGLKDSDDAFDTRPTGGRVCRECDGNIVVVVVVRLCNTATTFVAMLAPIA
jgi:hypothetical protein